jgi:hypothetical protein
MLILFSIINIGALAQVELKAIETTSAPQSKLEFTPKLILYSATAKTNDDYESTPTDVTSQYRDLNLNWKYKFSEHFSTALNLIYKNQLFETSSTNLLGQTIKSRIIVYGLSDPLLNVNFSDSASSKVDYKIGASWLLSDGKEKVSEITPNEFELSANHEDSFIKLYTGTTLYLDTPLSLGGVLEYLLYLPNDEEEYLRDRHPIALKTFTKYKINEEWALKLILNDEFTFYDEDFFSSNSRHNRSELITKGLGLGYKYNEKFSANLTSAKATSTRRSAFYSEKSKSDWVNLDFGITF